MWCHFTTEVFSSLSVAFLIFLDYFSFTCHTGSCITNFLLKVLDGKVAFTNFCEAAAKFRPEMYDHLHNYEELNVYIVHVLDLTVSYYEHVMQIM